MTKLIRRFTSTDQTLTITAQEGKKGFNVKASVKTGKGKGQPKASTGARNRFDTEAEAVKSFESLGKEAVKRGWSENAITVKNAFTEIPPPAAPVTRLVKK